MLKKIGILLLAGIVSGGSLLAVDLKNYDQNSYRVVYNEAGTMRSKVVTPGQTLSGICTECDVHIIGVGTIHAVGRDYVVIENRNARIE